MGEVKYSEDKKGFFHIFIDDARKEMVVEHYLGVRKPGVSMTASGKLMKKYGGKKAEKLYRQILADDTDSRLDHAAYLGYELGKAETALKNNLDYTQDEGVLI